MKKSVIVILAIFGGVFLLAIAANFLLPMFVSVDDYKGKIQAGFEQATGYSIEFGDIDLALLPTIHASATEVRISNGTKILAEIAEINAYADPMLLIKGDLKVSSVDVNAPKIFLENYVVANNSGVASTDFSIDKINIINGEVNYDDRANQKKYQLTNVNLSSAFAGFANPIILVGGFEFGKNKFAGDVKIDGANIALNLDGMNTQASFSGTQEKGDFKINSADINKIAVLLDKKYTLDFLKPNLLASGSFAIGAESKLVDMQEFKIGDSAGAGKVSFQADGNIIADIKMQNIVVEDFQFSQAEKTTKNIVPADLKLRLSLKSEQLKYKQLNLTNLDLQTAINKGEVVLQPLSFNFQDGAENSGDFEMFGVYNQPTEDKSIFQGKLQASGTDLRKIFADYGLDVGAIKPTQLKIFSLDTNLFVNIDEQSKLDFAGLQLEVDNAKFSGASQINLNDTPEISISGGVNYLNLDELFVEKKVATSTADIKAAAKNKITLNFDWLKNLSADLKLALIFGEVVANNRAYQNLHFTALAQRGKMQVQNMEFSTLDTDIGGDLELNVAGERPYVNTNLNVGVINVEPQEIALEANPQATSARWSQEPINLSPLDEIDGDFNINLLSLRKGDLVFDNVKASGNLSDEQVNIKDLSASAFGGQLNVVGVVGVGNIPNFQLKFIGDNMDMRQLAVQLARNTKLSGIMNLSGNLGSSGANEAALVQNLKGSVGFAGTNLIVYGFDIEGFVSKLANINNPIEVGVIAAKVLNGEGQTLIASLQGGFGVEKGVAHSQGISLLTRVGQGLFKGDIDLPKWQMDTNAYFAINLGDEKERPQIGARLYGPIDNFKKDYDYSEIVSYYSKRFGIADKIGGVLDNIRIPE